MKELGERERDDDGHEEREELKEVMWTGSGGEGFATAQCYALQLIRNHDVRGRLLGRHANTESLLSATLSTPASWTPLRPSSLAHKTATPTSILPSATRMCSELRTAHTARTGLIRSCARSALNSSSSRKHTT